MRRGNESVNGLKWAAVAAFLLSGVASVAAQESLLGRWGMSDAACSSWSGSTQADSALMVSTYAILWHDGYCRVARMYKTDKAVHIEARCWSTGEDRSIPVTLEPASGNRLKATWNRGTPAMLKRCP
jgi:hypothetical protein